ncbi:MAG: NADH-quinone oxidoreductase subunit NuoF [Deltaproteobacteria bacterium]|nr:NADH-quinone oxidoreductase subunit NuoF [Deltaproteobacteria bacterium]
MNLISDLKAIQERYGYLPEDELRAFSQRTATPLYQIQAVASFYPHFRLRPGSQLEVKVCADLSCHLAGARQLRQAAERHAATLTGCEAGAVSCLGRCDQAPAVAINDAIYAGVDERRLSELLTAFRQGTVPNNPFVQHGSATLTLDPYARETDRFAALRAVLATHDVAKVIQTLKDSGLRGMGGAGFPTGVKWEIVRNAAGTEKYVVVNADESEPGTFKDRFLMEKFPHLLIEGTLLGAYVVGAQKAYIFIRHEYRHQEHVLAKALAEARAQGLMGTRILGAEFSCDIEIFVSAGGYICGEETALLEALEGKRAEPRNKPPFPGTYGLWGKPTLINNVETLCMIPAILQRGAAWFKSQGRSNNGLKYLGLSGHVERPGVYEVPLGLPVEEFINEYGGGVSAGRKLKAFSPGGASSGFLPASMAGITLDFQSLTQAGSMLGSGAVVALAKGTCMLDAALNVVTFFRNESCGKCVPCRVGSDKIVQILDRATRGQAETSEIDLIGELAETMQLTSICGLGQAAPLPITSALKHFGDEIMMHLTQKRCPEGVCFR